MAQVLTEIAKYELNMLDPLQHEWYTTADPSEPISSLFYEELEKSLWYSRVLVKANGTLEGNKLTIPVNQSYHQLCHLYLIQKLPRISVKQDHKETVQICWTHNLGTNITPSATFSVDDDWSIAITSQWMDLYFQRLDKADKKLIARLLGNLPCLEGWNTSLPATKLPVPQPWYYTLSYPMSFPIRKGNSQTRIAHTYTLRREVSKLLRMRVRRDGQWVILSKPNFKYLDIAPDTLLPTPEAYIRYGYMTPSEKAWYGSCGKDEETLYLDIEVVRSKNPVPLNSSHSIPIDTKSYVRAMYWMAQNKEAASKRYYSNYSTNPDDLYEGWNPVAHSTLEYGTDSRFDLDSIHTELMEAYYDNSNALEPGYNSYSFAADPLRGTHEVTVSPGQFNSSLTLKLQDTNPFDPSIEEEPDESEDGADNNNGVIRPTFDVYVLLITAKVLLVKDDKSGKKVFSVKKAATKDTNS